MILDSIQNPAPGNGAIRSAALPGAAGRNADPLEGGSGQEALGFFDLLDIVNPLQHIPVVSTVYRQVTGDEISAPARVLGGALFLGPIGFITSAFNAAVDAVSGSDVGETVWAAFSPEPTDIPTVQTVAAKQETPQSATTSPPAVEAIPVTVTSTSAATTNAPRGLFFQEMKAQGRVLAPVEVPARAAEAQPASDSDGFHSAMMEGLRKYESMLRNRKAAEEAARFRFNETL